METITEEKVGIKTTTVLSMEPGLKIKDWLWLAYIYSVWEKIVNILLNRGKYFDTFKSSLTGV